MQIIYKENKEIRIDKYLNNLDKEKLYSRTYIARLIAQNRIKVNSQTVKKSYKLQNGDIIEIDFPPEKRLILEAEKIPLEIVYEDRYLAIIEKPADMVVHPAPGNYTGTLVNALTYHFEDNLSSGSDKLRPGIVHRLDKDTSGLIIIAKDDRTHSYLSQMFLNQQIDKFYQAIIVGEPPADNGTIENFIRRSKADRKKMTVAPNGKKAITQYEVIEYLPHFTLLDICLITGRTHQIRVHFSHLNRPILGDRTYCGLKRTLGQTPINLQKKVKYLYSNYIKRQALHAYKLKFVHPITEKNICIENKLPEDMQKTLAYIKENFSI